LSGTEFSYSIEQGWRWSRAIQDGNRTTIGGEAFRSTDIDIPRKYSGVLRKEVD